MTCLNCGGATCVTDSGSAPDEVIRRRKCKECGYIFYTAERDIDVEKAWSLLKSYKRKKP